MMSGVKGRSGVGSGGAGRGQGRKKKRVIIETGMTFSLSRVSNDGAVVTPAVEAEVIHIGGENGHERQFTIVTSEETITFFVFPKAKNSKMRTGNIPGAKITRKVHA